jgi:hypothetical protein
MTESPDHNGFPSSEQLAHYQVPGAPADFADRLMSRIASTEAPRQPAARSRRWMAWVAAGVVAAAAGVALWTVTRGASGSMAGRGDRIAGSRETIELGGRGVAVLEPAADVSWTVESSGAALVEQRSGIVFYRVERGGPFEVQTPLGTVKVVGTCFHVEVSDVNKDKLKGAAVGAAIASAVVVTVYEGQVIFANPKGDVTIRPGETGVVQPGASTNVQSTPIGSLARTAATQGATASGNSRPAAPALDSLEKLMPRPNREWFEALPPDPSWDAPREKRVIDQLAKATGVRLDPSSVECRTRCCRLTIRDDVYEAHRSEWMSSVGLGFEPTQGMAMTGGDNPALTVCWPERPPESPMPDRAGERAALLARTSEAIRACAQGLTYAISLWIELDIDKDGSIKNVDSNRESIGHPAATCAENAILQAASFAPAPHETNVPLSLKLGPAK